MAKKKRKEALVLSISTSTNGVEENIALGQRLLVMGAFSGEPNKGAPLKNLKDVYRVKDITNDNFDERLATQKIRMEMSVTNHLAGGGQNKLKVATQLRSIRDLDPDQLADESAYLVSSANDELKEEALEPEFDDHGRPKKDEKGNPVYLPRPPKRNDLADAVALCGALEQLQLSVEQVDSDSIYGMLYEVAQDLRARPAEAAAALSKGDILRTLKVREPDSGS